MKLILYILQTGQPNSGRPASTHFLLCKI